MTSEPLVSIVTPSYNQGAFIEETLRSVKNQMYGNVEHIVVDGGSTDETLDVLHEYESEYELRWVSEPDDGQSDAVNKGLEMANGEIVGWLNSDDVYFCKQALTTIVEAFASNSRPDIVYGDDVFLDQAGRVIRARRLYDWNYDRLRYWGLWGWTPASEATFYRREVIDACKLESSLRYVPDLEYFLRLGQRYDFHHVDVIIAGKRKHAETKSSNHDCVAKEAKEVLSDYGVDFGLVGKTKLTASLLRIQVQWIMGLRTLFEAADEDLAFDGTADRSVCSLLKQLPGNGVITGR